MADEKKARYSKPASQVDLERRQENGNASPLTAPTADESTVPLREDTGGRDFRVEDNDISNYRGVDPIYQNYANDTEKPLRAEEGAEAEVFKQVEEDGKRVVEVSKELDKGEPEESLGDENSNASVPEETGTINTPPSVTSPGENPEQVKAGDKASDKAADKSKTK